MHQGATRFKKQSDAATGIESRLCFGLDDADAALDRKRLRHWRRQHKIKAIAVGFVVGVNRAHERVRHGAAGVVLPEISVKAFQ